MNLTRRQLAGVIASAAVAAPVVALPQAESGAGDLLAIARDRIKTNGEALAAETVLMSTEPAFQFHA